MLIHLSMEELVAVRDGEGSVVAREHLDGCEACMWEMERLHQRIAALKALPVTTPPRDRWDSVRHAVVADRKSRRSGVAGWYALAAAASMVLMVGIKGLPVLGFSENELHEQQLNSLIEESQQLESALRTIQPRIRVINGRTAHTVFVIEDRIAEIDEELFEIRDLRQSGKRSARLRKETVINREKLWRQRVQLMEQLVRTHAIRSTNVGF